jgi:pimeloyl-ACP methyl ester carboxylesterase
VAEPFELRVPQAVLDDLRDRLARTRWAGALDGPGWEDGTSPAWLRDLAAYWERDFDWRAHEAAINRFAHFRAAVDGVRLHFVHERGRGPAPLPLVLTHGWPSTFYELLPLVSRLTDPAAHGADPADAFDVVIPSLPGYGFSDALPGRGSAARIPGLWLTLMRDVLGYERFGAHGGDIGAMVTNRLAYESPREVLGIHVALVAEPDAEPPLDAAERAFLAERALRQETSGAYAHVQRTRPQTLAYGLDDSPVGLAAWILDRWWDWSDCGGDLERRFTKDQLLTTVTLYWVTRTIGSSFRIYRDWALGAYNRPEAWRDRADVPADVEKPLEPRERIGVPAAVAVWEAHYPRTWAERAYGDLRRFTDMPRGGHFAAMEEPDLLAADIRAFFSSLR